MSAPVLLGPFERLVGGHAALSAAARAGVLERLAAQPMSARTLAEAISLDPRLLDALLRALAATGVLEADAGGHYRAAPAAVTVLELLESTYDGLPDALRGHPPGDAMDSLAGAAARYPGMVGLLAEVLADAAAQAASLLARPDQRILDVGAGAAPWSLALARAEPSSTIVAVDLPEVLPATRAAVEHAGLTDRVTLAAGDVRTLPLESQHDLVVAGNLCHLFDPPGAAELIARLAGALRPGGQLAVIDVPGDPETLADPATAVYALGLTLRTTRGTLHPGDAYRQWLADAGLAAVARHPLDGSELAVFTGQRPEPAR